MRGKEKLQWVFFTDLDGTLLDHATYKWTRARRALTTLRRRGIPLVIVTSKPRPELFPLLRALGRREPFVVENGGAIYLPAAYFPFRVEATESAGKGWRRLVLGVPRNRLVRALDRASRRAHVRVRGFSEMSGSEVAKLTGMRLTSARQAMRREFDEPFVIQDQDQRSVIRLGQAIRREGLRMTRGSRFFHILGANDKGAAVRRLKSWFRRLKGFEVRAVGLGDSPNDVALLRAVDLPILVARPDGRYDTETLAAVPKVRRAGGIGPGGWDRAVRRVLREGK